MIVIGLSMKKILFLLSLMTVTHCSIVPLRPDHGSSIYSIGRRPYNLQHMPSHHNVPVLAKTHPQVPLSGKHHAHVPVHVPSISKLPHVAKVPARVPVPAKLPSHISPTVKVPPRDPLHGNPTVSETSEMALIQKQLWAQAHGQSYPNTGEEGNREVVHDRYAGKTGMTALKDGSRRACFLTHYLDPFVLPQDQRDFYQETMPATVFESDHELTEFRKFVGPKIATHCRGLKSYWLDQVLFYRFTEGSRVHDLRSHQSEGESPDDQTDPPVKVPDKMASEMDAHDASVGRRREPFPIPTKNIAAPPHKSVQVPEDRMVVPSRRVVVPRKVVKVPPRINAEVPEEKIAVPPKI